MEVVPDTVKLVVSDNLNVIDGVPLTNEMNKCLVVPDIFINNIPFDKGFTQNKIENQGPITCDARLM